MSINPMFYSEEVKIIDEIEFSISRNKDVRIYSSVNGDPFGIDIPQSYNGFDPIKGGLVDARMGTCDIYIPCAYCGENNMKCEGHFAHTELAEPVFHLGFMPHLRNIMSCMCIYCGKLLLDKTDTHYKKALLKKAEMRFKEIKTLVKNTHHCPHCNTPVPKIKKEVKDNGTLRLSVEREIEEESKEGGKTIRKSKEFLSPRDCYNKLRTLSDNDCFIMGFNPKMQRPEDLIITTLPIAPVAIRPTSKMDVMSSATMEDALTLKYSDIIQFNKRLRQVMEKETAGEESSQKQDLTNIVQYHVATFYDNESTPLPRTEFKTGGRQTKSIRDRLSGKHGRFRSNLEGKRVDFSARSVITSDPYINIDQVGIPKKIAMELTIPEEVTPYNIKYLTGLVKNGRYVYPGANYVLRKTYIQGKQEIQSINLKYNKISIKLTLGDIVERHCIDGDYVLFNRQPTLHRPSMMGHQVQIIDDDNLNTFRMNVSVCKPYNADFDGDFFRSKIIRKF